MMEEQEVDLEMQTPTQKVLNQPEQIGTISNPTGTWQSEQDTDLRRHIVEYLRQLFQGQYPMMSMAMRRQIYDRLGYLLCPGNKRQVYEAGFLGLFPQMTVEMWQQLPVLVKHVEEALYKLAPSKAEYANLHTLAIRMTAMVNQMMLVEYSPYVQVPHRQSKQDTNIAIRLESTLKTFQSTSYSYF